jgi:ABC-type uncharacterized transport system auxiliary subunit
MREKSAAFLIALAITGLFGCGAVPSTKYYQLTVPNSIPSVATAASVPVTLVVSMLRTAPLYRNDRLVYAAGEQAMGMYEYERWAASPPQMIQEVMVRELRASGRYRAVESLSSTSRGDFLLRGNLYDFKEVSGSALTARVTLALALQEAGTNATVWTHYYTHDEPVTGKDVGSVVAALNRNVQQAVGEMSASLSEYFASHPPAPATPR